MVEYLQGLLAGQHAFMVCLRHVDGYSERAALHAVDNVGLVLEGEGGPAMVPWSRIARCSVEFC